MYTVIADIHLQFQQLHSRVKELEKEKKEVGEDYNTQRATFRKLFLQKEEELKNVTLKQISLETKVERLSKELNEAKSQLYIAGIKENEVEEEKLKAQAEIASLNEIINGRYFTNSIVPFLSQNEVKRLKQVIQTMESQPRKQKAEKEKEGILLAPSNVLSGAKSLAKKVVGQLGNDSDFRSHDNLEDSMKKYFYQAQEDTEVLRSVVLPLEKNIQELSEKLAAAEEKIRKYESGEVNNVPIVSPSKSVSCGMCVNYEAQLVSQQQLAQQLMKEKEIVEMNMQRVKEDLVKETQFRKCMEDKWNEKKEEHKVQVSKLKSLYENAEKEMKILKVNFQQVQEEVKKELASLRFDREKINAELEQLQRDNDNLMGKHSAHSEQLRNESINFPDNVADLQELLLKTHEELIAAKVAKEVREEEVNTLKSEIQLLTEQMDKDLLSRSEIQNSLNLENSKLRKQIESKERERLKLHDSLEKLKAADARNEEEILSKTLEENISELRNRVGSLQQELDTSETVQKDFVKLSQSLQVELEKIRGADTEVRWQHIEDAVDCFGCKILFTSAKKKSHCRHCGKVFCSSCLTHVVRSGPNSRPSNVCQVCHTLLNSETAPYFSQEPPHSPD
ncbi:UNVERIFIED_CONTAM: hypothetical protein PYX00_005523 [Menopon gallinae]|uniref:FYVE-type domain-containing protein n=1 Tax=Menopon gallinae TaxID=328185 RepID=A0AAW2HS06_9NEOP